jgi:hypothetical protein
MMLLSVDPVSKSAAIISFPRDLWLQIPGFGEERINAAYPYGELRSGAGGGPAAVAQTLEQNLASRRRTTRPSTSVGSRRSLIPLAGSRSTCRDR